MTLPSVVSFLSQRTPQEELLDACGDTETRGNLCEWTYELTSSTTAAEIMDFLSRPLRVIGLLIAAYIINRLARFYIRRLVVNLAKEKSQERFVKFKRKTGLSKLETSENTSFRLVQRAETMGVAIKGVASFSIAITTIILILQTYNVDIAPLLAGAGLIGVALGFGAQTMVRDFLAGIFIISEDWYGVGDVIDVGEATGTVELVTLRATHIRDIHGAVWHIPNGEIVRAGNMSQQWARAVLDIGVALDADIEKAKEVIGATANAVAKEENFATEILDDPEVLGVQEIAADRILIRVIVKVIPSSQWSIARELRARIKLALDENGVELPPAIPTALMKGATGDQNNQKN